MRNDNQHRWTMFLYWIPERRPAPAITLDELRSLGLGYAFDSKPITAGCDHGPGGTWGSVISSDRTLKYLPDRQTWKPLVDLDGGLQVGVWKDRPPQPEALLRDSPVVGEYVELGGRQWLIPKARQWDEYDLDGDKQILFRCGLPSRLQYAGGGKWIPGEVVDRYARLWSLACQYSDELQQAMAAGETANGIVRFNRPECADAAAVEALAANYRIGPVELDLLGAWDETAATRILDVVLDSSRWQQLVKKKLEEASTDTARTSTTSSGGPRQPTLAGT